MNHKIILFIELAELLSKNGFSAFLVGGTVRDYLLNKELSDMDLVTSATPKELNVLFPNIDMTFKNYGSVKLIYKGEKFDITTLRKENGYSDYRHPSKIEFTNDIKEDVIRRDLTINGLYMDSSLNIIDLVSGVNDINNKILRFIGDPLKRIKEDPLRIIRLFRFELELGFAIEQKTKEIVNNHLDLIKKINQSKIEQEIKKSSFPIELRNKLKDY